MYMVVWGLFHLKDNSCWIPLEHHVGRGSIILQSASTLSLCAASPIKRESLLSKKTCLQTHRWADKGEMLWHGCLKGSSLLDYEGQQRNDRRLIRFDGAVKLYFYLLSHSLHADSGVVSALWSFAPCLFGSNHMSCKGRLLRAARTNKDPRPYLDLKLAVWILCCAYHECPSLFWYLNNV